eukprot:403374147
MDKTKHQKARPKLEKLQRIIKRLDKFGHPITLLYNGESTHKTVFGGFCSILAVIIIALFFAIQLRLVILREHIHLTYSYIQKNKNFNDHGIILTKENFDIAVLIKNSVDQNIITDVETYFIVDFNKLIDINGSTQGDFISFFRVTVQHCTQAKFNKYYPNSNKTCKSIDQINAIIPFVQLEFYVYQKYFDDKEFNDVPIKKFIKYFNFKLLTDVAIVQRMRIVKQQLTTQDNFLSNQLSSKTYEYHSVDFDYVQLTDLSTAQSLFTFSVQLDDQIKVINRSVYTIADALSQTGGIIGIILPIFSFFIRNIQSSLFYLQIIKDNFIKKKCHTGKDKNFELKRGFNGQFSLDKQMFNGLNQFEKTQQSPIKLINIEFNSSMKETQTMKGRIFEEFYDKFIHLKNYKAKSWRVICKSIPIINSMSQCAISAQKFLAYSLGKQQLKQEFEVTELIRTQRNQKLMMKLLYNKSQRHLFKYQKANLIDQSILNNQAKVNQRQNAYLIENYQNQKSGIILDPQEQSSQLQQYLTKLINQSQKNSKSRKILEYLGKTYDIKVDQSFKNTKIGNSQKRIRQPSKKQSQQSNFILV